MAIQQSYPIPEHSFFFFVVGLFVEFFQNPSPHDKHSFKFSQWMKMLSQNIKRNVYSKLSIKSSYLKEVICILSHLGRLFSFFFFKQLRLDKHLIIIKIYCPEQLVKKIEREGTEFYSIYEKLFLFLWTFFVFVFLLSLFCWLLFKLKTLIKNEKKKKKVPPCKAKEHSIGKRTLCLSTRISSCFHIYVVVFCTKNTT